MCMIAEEHYSSQFTTFSIQLHTFYLNTFVYFLSVGLGLVTRKITKSVGKNQIKPEMLIEIVRNRETKASGSSLY